MAEFALILPLILLLLFAIVNISLAVGAYNGLNYAAGKGVDLAEYMTITPTLTLSQTYQITSTVYSALPPFVDHDATTVSATYDAAYSLVTVSMAYQYPLVAGGIVGAHVYEESTSKIGPVIVPPPTSTLQPTSTPVDTATSMLTPAETGTPTSTAVPVSTVGLVGYWTFDEGSGATAYDTSGNNNSGALYGGVSWSAGRFGDALTFDGTSGYVSAGVTNVPAANAAQSISFWLSIPSGATSNPNPQDAISLTNSGQASGVQAGMRNGTMTVWQFGGNTLVAAPTPPTSDTWHNWVYTFDGATHDLYEDGTLVATSTATPGDALPDTLTFGGESTMNWLSGNLDDIRIYNRALSADEVQSLASQP